MQEILIRSAIKFFGSISEMAKKLKISRQSIYRYLEGQPIDPDVASLIEKATKGKIKFKKLIPWRSKFYIELDDFTCSLVKTHLNKIIFPADILSFLHQKDLPLSDYRPICVDENLNLIYGLEHIEAAKKWWKKTVFSWHISLEDLRNKKYEVRYLIKTFNLIERMAIRNALEKFIGKRQGRRTDLDELVDLHPQVQGIKTRDFVADVLGFGSDYVCRMLNKIFRHGSRTLLLEVLEGKISISKAGEIAEYLYNKQKSIRVVKKRKQTIDNDDYKNIKKNLTKSFDFLSQFNK